MRMTASLVAAATLALAGPALAQETSRPAPGPVFPPQTDLDFGGDAAPAPTQADSILSSQGRVIGGNVTWTGFYVGGQLGAGFADTDFSNDDEGVTGGVTAGYDHDFGRYVIGGALDFDFADVEIAPNSDLEEIFRLKVRGGPKIGRGLIYGAGGWANGDTSNSGSENGWFIGGGYEYPVSDRVSVGGEVLYHDFGNFRDGNDVDFTTVQVRATFRF